MSEDKETIEFEISVHIGLVGCTKIATIDIPMEDLEHLPEDEWDDYVWEELGGKETAYEFCDIGCYRK